MIKRLTEEDIDKLVRLRSEVLGGFLTTLGPFFLKEYYRSLLSLPNVAIFTASNKNKVVGFATLAYDTKNIFMDIWKRNIWGVAFSLLFYIITHPFNIIKILQSFLYKGFLEEGAEILSIAIDKKHQGKGWGRKLFERAIDEFKRKKIHSFRISTYTNDKGANIFYKKMGCILMKEFDFRQEKMNYYEYTIS